MMTSPITDATPSLARIQATKAYFIKLGRGGQWEAQCLRDGMLRFGYREASHDDCLNARWERVQEFWLRIRDDKGAATRDTNQIRIFYEAEPDTLFVTFHGGLLYWCRARSGVVVDPTDDTRIRQTVDGWHSTSIRGHQLRTDRLSGALLRMQGFRGTICSVGQLSYLLGRINDEISPAVVTADDARAAYKAAIENLIGLLTWQDFELLIDLIFASSGWRRIGALGKTQKSIDLELQLPTTGEIAFIQVKSEATAATLREYIGQFSAYDKYDRMFFAWHKGKINTVPESGDVVLLSRSRIAEMVLDAGLGTWLRDKVS
jgi:hypothetical protein